MKYNEDVEILPDDDGPVDYHPAAVPDGVRARAEQASWAAHHHKTPLEQRMADWIARQNMPVDWGNAPTEPIDDDGVVEGEVISPGRWWLAQLDEEDIIDAEVVEDEE